MADEVQLRADQLESEEWVALARYAEEKVTYAERAAENGPIEDREEWREEVVPYWQSRVRLYKSFAATEEQDQSEWEGAHPEARQ